MRRSLVIFVFLAACIIDAHSQADSTASLKRIERALQSQTLTVSKLLMETRYMPLHPLTSFRELVKRYANTDTLRIAPLTEPGKRISVGLIITSEDGKPIANALVYLYHTDTRGWYAADSVHVSGNEGDHRHARLFGYGLTDLHGRMQLSTIKPNGYPQSDLPAHIHIVVSATGYQALVTELLFDDDGRLKGEVRERSIGEGFQIAKPQAAGTGSAQRFEYLIRLRSSQ